MSRSESETTDVNVYFYTSPLASRKRTALDVCEKKKTSPRLSILGELPCFRCHCGHLEID